MKNVVLSEGEAKALWGNDDPVGGQVRIEGRVFTVSGVVADSHTTSLKTPPARMAYAHFRDRPPFPTYFLIRASNAGALVAGLACSLLAGRAIERMLYGTRAVDLPVILMVTVLFPLSATAAAFLPARRAASVDPMEALRSE